MTKRHRWTEAEVEHLLRDYADGITSEIATQLGIDIRTVYTKAHALNLKKSPTYLREHARIRPGSNSPRGGIVSKGGGSWRKGMTGAPWDAPTEATRKAKISATLRARWADEGFRKINEPRVKSQASARWNSNGYRTKVGKNISAGLKKSHENPSQARIDAKAKLALVAQTGWNSPIYRAARLGIEAARAPQALIQMIDCTKTRAMLKQLHAAIINRTKEKKQ